MFTGRFWKKEISCSLTSLAAVRSSLASKIRNDDGNKKVIFSFTVLCNSTFDAN
jgi:hypothetical protein